MPSLASTSFGLRSSSRKLLRLERVRSNFAFCCVSMSAPSPKNRDVGHPPAHRDKAAMNGAQLPVVHSYSSGIMNGPPADFSPLRSWDGGSRYPSYPDNTI